MLFFTTKIEEHIAFFDEEESRHLLTVLRRRTGDLVQLTDGKGNLFNAELIDVGKKQAVARIISQIWQPDQRPLHLHIAIAPTKNIDRFEWFLEKATEIGVNEITPMICHFSERKQLRLDRMEKILQSAMKQSLRTLMPQIHTLTDFSEVVQRCTESQKCIAWCQPEVPAPHFKSVLQKQRSTLLLVGPEGDFSKNEVELAKKYQFQEVSLGTARLRTETAGIFAAAVVACLDV